MVGCVSQFQPCQMNVVGLGALGSFHLVVDVVQAAAKLQC
jgi:hypothetical protein